MDTREQFLTDIVTNLQFDFSNDQVILIRNKISVLMVPYDIVVRETALANFSQTNDYYVRRYLAVKGVDGCSDKTLQCYQYHIDKFINTVNMPYSEITTSVVRSYLARMGRICQNSYIDDARRILNGFFDFLVMEELIRKNPCRAIKKIKHEEHFELPYTDIEVEMIRDACRTPRERALIDFLFSTGCRREEVTKIQLKDLSLVNRSCVIHGKGGKTRMVYFSARTQKHLKDYINSKEHPSDYLFSSTRYPYGKLSNEGIVSIVKGIGNRANVENVHMHRFRKWFATYMANQGLPIQDVQRMLGHAKVDTTNRYYVTANHTRIENNHRQYAP